MCIRDRTLIPLDLEIAPLAHHLRPIFVFSLGPEITQVLPAKDVNALLVDELPDLRQHCITVVLTIVASLRSNNGTKKLVRCPSLLHSWYLDVTHLIFSLKHYVSSSHEKPCHSLSEQNLWKSRLWKMEMDETNCYWKVYYLLAIDIQHTQLHIV